ASRGVSDLRHPPIDGRDHPPLARVDGPQPRLEAAREKLGEGGVAVEIVLRLLQRHAVARGKGPPRESVQPGRSRRAGGSADRAGKRRLRQKRHQLEEGLIAHLPYWITDDWDFIASFGLPSAQRLHRAVAIPPRSWESPSIPAEHR